ncbi:MAG: TrkA C-terminal domain-containing protein, partial [Oscillospiraceae bacterium]|nr:TrkA C-terminal domain-containing protein [Oscillospiraceae bacterium]
KQSRSDFYFGILIPLAATAVIFVFMRVPAVHAWGDRHLQKLADRIVGQTDRFNSVMLMDYIGTETIAQVTLHHIPDEYVDVPLSRMGLKAETGILVMLIEKPGKKAEPAGADTMFSVGDKLTVFGDYAVICRTFHARERFADTANGE